MKVNLVQDGYYQFAKLSHLNGSVEKTGTIILTEALITADDYDGDKRYVGEREKHIFITHLKAADFWKETRELSVSLKKHEYLNCIHLTIQGNCLAELRRIFGSDIKLQVATLQEEHEEVLSNSKEMEVISSISSNARKRPKYEAYCEDDNMEVVFSNDMMNSMLINEIGISISVIGSFHKSIGDASSIYAKMLNEKIETDVTIVANDGTSIPCHKVFLAQSSVFAAMFTKGCKKSKTNIKTDIPAKSLKPFLNYLYFQEVSGPTEDPQVAIDLLRASHKDKYDVDAMATKMQQILYESPNGTFTVDEALQLFMCVRNVGVVGKYDLKKKAVSIFEDCTVGSVLNSEVFKNFFASTAAFEVAKDIMKNVKEARCSDSSPMSDDSFDSDSSPMSDGSYDSDSDDN